MYLNTRPPSKHDSHVLLRSYRIYRPSFINEIERKDSHLHLNSTTWIRDVYLNIVVGKLHGNKNVTSEYFTCFCLSSFLNEQC